METNFNSQNTGDSGSDNLETKINRLNFIIEQERKAREQAENELKDFRFYYENLFSNNSQPMWIYDLETLRFLDVNSAATEHYGFSKEEFLSMTLLDIRPKEDAELLLRDVENTMNTYNNAGIWRHIKKNGETIFVEIVSHSLIFNNRRARHVKVNDITHRLKVENALKDNEIILKLFIENAPASLAMFDINMRYITCSRRWLTEYSIKDETIIGKSHYEVFPEIGDYWKGIHQRALNGDIIIKDCDEFIREDGTSQFLRWEVRPWLFSNGSIGGVVIFSEDITEKLRLEAETLEAKNRAIQSDKLKSAFLANISHEIRTPLNGILGFSEILQSGSVSEDEGKEYLQIIDSCGKRMLNTINNIVNISLLDSGLIKINYSVFNINDLLDYLYKYFTIQAVNQNLEFRTQTKLSTDEALINSDYDKVLSVLYNMVENSFKFTESGYITVCCKKRDGKFIELEVLDTGIGIPEEQQPYIFEKYRQGSEKFSRNYEGSGVGLYISKAYIELLGGEISFESIPGKGTSFRFTIPLKQH